MELEADERKEKHKLQLEAEAHREKVKLELEAEEKRHQRELEAQERERERQYEYDLKRLELSAKHQPADTDDRPQVSGFRIDTSIKLIPKFNEHDVESFLLSFEKIAKLNSFPEDKYAAILQAHLTGKALKVFTALTVEV